MDLRFIVRLAHLGRGFSGAFLSHLSSWSPVTHALHSGMALVPFPLDLMGVLPALVGC